MEKTIIRFEITIPTEENQLLNDVIRMIAPLKYLFNRIPGVSSEYKVFDMIPDQDQVI